MPAYTEQISRGFKDISFSFTRHPVTNDVTVLRNEDAIKKSVQNLVKTRINERFFNDLLGLSVEASLFEVVGSDISSSLTEEIKTLLENFEPRIKVLDIIVNDTQDYNGLYITIKYSIIGLPVPTQNIEFLLQPSRI
tara:strand:- start:1685 stop:2095 length:411 start_codon:yes stop_codon:yes gene_type:complete